MRIITPLQPSLDPVQSALNSVGEGDMGESVSELEGGGQDEAIQLLASHGITMLPEDPPTFTLTEAGKLALLSSSQPLPLVKCEIKIENPDSENDLNPVDIHNYLDLQHKEDSEQSIENSATNKYSCGRCGRSYLHQATLVRHQRYECGITASYPCQLCGRKFKRRDVLKGHMEKCMSKSSVSSPASANSSINMTMPSIAGITSLASAMASAAAMPSLPHGLNN